MTLRTAVGVTAVVSVLAIAWLIHFGVSDFVAPDRNSILVTKPWRPWCRLAFSVVMATVLAVGSIGFLKFTSRRG